jgi:hypothetical protein
VFKRGPRVTRAVRLTAAIILLTGVVASPVAAVGRSVTAVTPPAGLTMEARVLLNGHARVGSWMAIDVHLANDGPPISGELRLPGGVQGRTVFSTIVDVPTQSDKTYRLYAQPPGFGSDLEVSLVDGPSTIATAAAEFSVHEIAQTTVGIVAENPGEIIGDLELPANANNVKPLTVGLTPADLPSRVEAWGALDRLIWQDTDSASLDNDQLAALRGWVAGGGRLIVAGGTAGPSSLSAFPEDMLPFRPATTTDVAPSSLAAMLGEVPDGATDVPALAGELTAGRSLASVGDQTVAAERQYGSGSVTIVGFDPTAEWLAGTQQAESLWRRLIPSRVPGTALGGDDSQMVQAASQLPTLALPPIEGLIALLGGYILLIGPINYLVLRHFDKREWAWVTMPALIVAFAVGAYGFGTVLRGSDVIINEVAIVRGAPGATEGLAQAYYGVFSPTRRTYQVRVPGGALLSTPVSGDFAGAQAAGGSGLDVLQGDPARIRDLGVGFGSLRTVKAESAVTVPLIRTELRLEDDRLKGTITNDSDQTIESPVIVLGGSVARLNDLEPGTTATIDTPMQAAQINQSLSDKVVGPVFFGEPTTASVDGGRQQVRHLVIDHLTYDPQFGTNVELGIDRPVFLGWSDRELLPVQIEGQAARRMGNVLWFLPTDIEISGETTFRRDVISSTVISSDAVMFNKDRLNINFGQGSADVSYRPMAFDGSIRATELIIGYNFGDMLAGEPLPIEPITDIPVICQPGDEADDCVEQDFDGLPEVELYDLSSGSWRRLPHMTGGWVYRVADPAKYVDPATGTVLARYINESSDSVSFNFDITITGAVS